MGWIARKKRIGIIGNGMTGKAAKQEKQQTSKNDRSILENENFELYKITGHLKRFNKRNTYMLTEMTIILHHLSDHTVTYRITDLLIQFPNGIFVKKYLN